MAVLAKTISVSADDASQTGTTVSITANPLSNLNSPSNWNGFRFIGITIPAGARVFSAFITVQFTSSTLDEPDVRIYGEKQAAPATFTTAASSISSRSKTTAFTDWSNTNAGTSDVQTSSLVSVVQELIDTYGAYNNGAMAFLWTSRAGTASRDTAVRSRDNSSTLCARLTITHTIPMVVNATAVSVTGTPSTLPQFSNLAFWLPLDEASGNRVDDHAAKTFTQYGTVASASDGTFGTVATFDGGSGDILKRNADSDISINSAMSFSVTFWFKPHSSSGIYGICSQMSASYSGFVFYIWQVDTTVLFKRYTDAFGTGEQGGSSYGIPTPDVWYFLTAVSDMANNRIGVSVNGGAFEWTACTTHTQVATSDFYVGDILDSLSPLNACEAFYLATRGAAQALYLEDRIGSIAVGMEADLIVLNMKSTPLIDFRLQRCENFAEALFVQMTMAGESAVAARFGAGIAR